MALPASVVVAGIVTVFIAVNNADNLVVDDYYKEGLGINRMLKQDTVARLLQIDASVEVDSLVGEVTVVLVANLTKTPEKIDMHWIHPTSQEKDFIITLPRSHSGTYLGQLPGKVDGRWYLQLSAAQPEPWRLKTEWQFSAESETDTAVIRFQYERPD